MIVFLLKFIACTGVLLLFYYGVLQNDRLFRFNRFFLLAIVILSLVIPITTVRTKVIEIPIRQEPVYTQMESSLDSSRIQDIPMTFESKSEPSVNWENVLWVAYLLIASVLLFRFSRNLHAILKLKRKSIIVEEKGVKIVLRTDIKASFSFLNYMYTNKTRYDQGNLPVEIIEHEKHHIDQKHSFDIIFIELIQCLLWFNPFVHFIKSAIKLNHEFLADQHVLKDDTSVYIYQKILLDITRKQFVNTPVFASNLNYGFTKKRLNMMTKNTNKFKSMIKPVAAAGIIACTFWLGGETQVIAQEKEVLVDLKVKEDPKTSSTLGPEINVDLKVKVDQQDTIKPKSDKQIVSIKRMGSVVLKNTLVRFNDQEGKLVEKKYQYLTKAEEARFKNLSSSPQFFLPPPPKGMMNQALLDDFMDAKKYGIWMDEKRIENSLLKTFGPKDFHHFTKRVLRSNAQDYGKYRYRLNLISTDYFDAQPYANGQWMDYKLPKIIEIPEQKTAIDKGNQEPAEVATVKSVKAKPQVIEVKSIREEKVKEKPQVIEVKSVREEKVKEKPQIIEVKSVREEKIKEKAEKKLSRVKEVKEVRRDTTEVKPISIKVKRVREEKIKNKSDQEVPKVKKVKEVKRNNSSDKETSKDDSQELGIKKGGFNPELHSPGIDLEKVEYFLAPTRSAHLKYKNKKGDYVITTYGEMTDKEYSRWINPAGKGQIFNPPAPKEEITMSRLIELKNQEEIEFWINGEKAKPQAIIALRYHEIYDMTVTETKADIITDLVFLQDDSAWMSRIRYKKVE